MGKFKDFIHSDDDDYKKRDPKREKKTSWKDESRKKRADRYKEENDRDD